MRERESDKEREILRQTDKDKKKESLCKFKFKCKCVCVTERVQIGNLDSHQIPVKPVAIHVQICHFFFEHKLFIFNSLS